MDSGKVLIGVLAGAAVGVTLGLLYAPRKGILANKKLTAIGNSFAVAWEIKFNQFIGEMAQQFDVYAKEAKEAHKTELTETEEGITKLGESS